MNTLQERLKKLPNFARQPIGIAVPQGGVGQVMSRGVGWFRAVFLTTLRRLDARPIGEPEVDDVHSYAWSVVGDIHHIVGAPLAARRAYERAYRRARFDESKCYALTEIANMRDQVGDRRRAVRFARRALEFGEGDGVFSPAEILERADRWYWPGDRGWLVAELLARGHHQKALRIAQHVGGTPGRLLQSHCLGSMMRMEDIVGQLRRVADGHRAPWLSAADEFYIPKEAFDAVGWTLHPSHYQRKSV